MWQPSRYWEKNRRWWQCRNCGEWQLGFETGIAKIPPRVLYFDIETSLTEMVVKTFDMRVRSGWLDWHEITKPFYVISWAAAWYSPDKTPKLYSNHVTGKEAIKRDDKRCLQELWELMDYADWVVGHNSKAFDVKKVETRFLLNSMGTPSDYKQKDTLAEAKKRFKAESNALDYWAQLLGADRKDDMRRADWEAVDRGDEKTIRKMHRYNRGDVKAGMQVLKQFQEHIESNSGTRLFK